ncbi:MAG: RHS repeat-associated core domain-containing protein, partial [Opitutaceae bacterium]
MVKKLRSDFFRDILGRAHWHNKSNDWEAPAKNPLFTGFSSELHLAIQFAYNDRHELMHDSPHAYRNGQWFAGAGQTDNQGKHRFKQFNYDHAGNPNVTHWSYHHWSSHQPNERNQLTSAFGRALAYDADGNLTNDGQWAYTYDAENRLTRLARLDGAQEIINTYDHLHRRVRMQARDGPGGPWWSKRFIHDGFNIIAELWDDNYSPIVQTLVWGLDQSGSLGGAGGIGGLLAIHSGGRAYLPLQDGLGSIHGYVDSTTGGTGAAWDFTAHGETIHERGAFHDGGGGFLAGSWDFRLRYQSKYADFVGPLIDFGRRFYHPGLGRFINRDPIEEAGGNNLYAYAGNDPVNRWDYLGMCSGEDEEDGDDICDELVPLPPYVINERRGDYGLPDDLFGDPNAG